MELDFISWLRKRLVPHRHLRLGPGDDAAVLRLGNRADCVVTTDLLTDGVDFRLDRVAPRRVGRKALAVNLSDLAAMAAEPLAVVVAVVLPRTGPRQLAEQLYEGMLPLAEKYDVAVAGGDTNVWDGPLAIGATALGRVTESGPLVRSGAQPGDAVVVTGSFGGSILGKHLDFEPRVREALTLAGRYGLHAGIDCSDGLSTDLEHLCQESGCGAEIETSAVPIDPAARRLAASAGDDRSPLEHALHDGEDFELILAVAPSEAARMLREQPLDVPLAQIGRFTSRSGLWQRTGQRLEPLEPHGWEHGRDG